MSIPKLSKKLGSTNIAPPLQKNNGLGNNDNLINYLMSLIQGFRGNGEDGSSNPDSADSDTTGENKSGGIFSKLGNFVGGIGEALGNAGNWFVSQFKGQTNTNANDPNNQNCVLASTLMLARLFGKTDGDANSAQGQIQALRGKVGVTNQEQGLTVDQATKALGAAGLKGKAEKTSVDKMAEELGGGQKKAFLTEVDAGILDGGQKSAHAIDVIGFNKDTNSFIVADPLNQGVKEVPKDVLAKAMESTGNNAIKVTG